MLVLMIPFSLVLLLAVIRLVFNLISTNDNYRLIVRNCDCSWEAAANAITANIKSGGALLG